MLREADYYGELGHRIQRARIALGLTQESLASSVGLTRTSMVNIEKGRQKVLAHTLVRLARSLKLRIDELAEDSTKSIGIDDLLRDHSELTKRFVRSAISPAHKDT